jgi:alkylation response protein AidB-like acyl-CoA dehydrogenase
MTSVEWLGSYCLTEPGAGSDAGSLRTRAEKDGDSYLISGSKVFISGAGATQVLVVMARTGSQDSGSKGVSAFVVPADAEGIHYGKCEEKMGWHSQPTRQVTFENVRVPVANRLGEEGEGFRIAMKGLDGGRLNIATCSLGGARAALLRARNYLHEREQFGQLPGPAVQAGGYGHSAGGGSPDGSSGGLQAGLRRSGSHPALCDGQTVRHRRLL